MIYYIPQLGRAGPYYRALDLAAAADIASILHLWRQATADAPPAGAMIETASAAEAVAMVRSAANQRGHDARRAAEHRARRAEDKRHRAWLASPAGIAETARLKRVLRLHSLRWRLEAARDAIRTGRTVITVLYHPRHLDAWGEWTRCDEPRGKEIAVLTRPGTAEWRIAKEMARRDPWRGEHDVGGLFWLVDYGARYLYDDHDLYWFARTPEDLARLEAERAKPVQRRRA